MLVRIQFSNIRVEQERRPKTLMRRWLEKFREKMSFGCLCLSRQPQLFQHQIMTCASIFNLSRPKEVSEKESSLIQRMKYYIDPPGKAKVFSSFDTSFKYGKITICKEDRAKTAFFYHLRLFKYLHLLFVLEHAPYTSERAVHRARA